MANPKIAPYKQIVPMIYAYTTPGVADHVGWIKIGYADKQTVEERIKQQLHTADIKWHLDWKDNAIYKDGSGEYFHDTDFHAWLVTYKNIQRKKGKEWFRIDPQVSEQYFNEFARREIPQSQVTHTYELRDEQKEAVNKTKACFAKGGDKFLWNAKPRFGKTLTAYELIRQAKFKHVLILSNRPSIANSWAEDFFKFIANLGEYAFVLLTASFCSSRNS